TLIIRDRKGGPINDFRKPVEATDAHKPRFTLYLDVLGALRTEFHNLFNSLPGDTSNTDEFLVDYSVSAGIGSKLLDDMIVDQTKPRTVKKMNHLKEILTDGSDMVDFFANNIDDPHKSESAKFLVHFMPDIIKMRINALRAGVGVYRSLGATGLTGSSTEVKAASESKQALIEYAKTTTPFYEALALHTVGTSNAGIKASTYFIPEWLFVQAFPMNPDKLEEFKRS
ncbi:MAG: hypothetical protein M3Q79_03785, partial [bacterium]|nr:hypothetical protein [bacterium]